MITCFLRYEIIPARIAEFEDYAARWIALVARFGGNHHGYFLPSEGASHVAYALFSFTSLAAYENYRRASATDPDCVEASRFAEKTGCIRSYERSFLRPFEGHAPTRSTTDHTRQDHH